MLNIGPYRISHKSRKLAKNMSPIRNLIYQFLCHSWFSQIVGRLLPGDIPTRIGWIKPPVGTSAEIKSKLLFGLYEYPERLLIKKHLPSDLDCIELGSSIGYISNHIARKLEKQCQITLVEALPQNMELLLLNTTMMRQYKKVRLICKAISYSGETVDFHIAESHLGGGIEATGKIVNLPATKLGDLLNQNSRFSLVMDIEGAEHELAEAADLSYCDCIIAEIHGTSQQIELFVRRVENSGLKLVEQKHSVFAFKRDPV
jgi:FkbM family methyltransferase